MTEPRRNSSATTKSMVGVCRVQTLPVSSTGGLAALERWLALLVGAGEDVAPLLERILQSTNSVAMLGVLVKYRQTQAGTFSAAYSNPLLQANIFTAGMSISSKSLSMHFDGMQLAPLGELNLRLSLGNWHFAPQHKATMTGVIVELITANDSFADFVRVATAAWKPPDDEKAAIEQRILSARLLDSNNYSITAEASK